MRNRTIQFINWTRGRRRALGGYVLIVMGYTQPLLLPQADMIKYDGFSMGSGLLLVIVGIFFAFHSTLRPLYNAIVERIKGKK